MRLIGRAELIADKYLSSMPAVQDQHSVAFLEIAEL